MADTTITKEGRVNVPLGGKFKSLTFEATKAGTTKTNLARILILDGISRLQTGEFRIKPQSVEPATIKLPARKASRKGVSHV